MSAAKPPAGWRIEIQGLSASVVFTKGPHGLIWCDGEWRTQRKVEGGWISLHAPGVPVAASMAQARVVGCAFLHEVEAA